MEVWTVFKFFKLNPENTLTICLHILFEGGLGYDKFLQRINIEV